jgi:hypothetical protein
MSKKRRKYSGEKTKGGIFIYIYIGRPKIDIRHKLAKRDYHRG